MSIFKAINYMQRGGCKTVVWAQFEMNRQIILEGCSFTFSLSAWHLLLSRAVTASFCLVSVETKSPRRTPKSLALKHLCVEALYFMLFVRVAFPPKRTERWWCSGPTNQQPEAAGDEKCHSQPSLVSKNIRIVATPPYAGLIGARQGVDY